MMRLETQLGFVVSKFEDHFDSSAFPVVNKGETGAAGVKFTTRFSLPHTLRSSIVIPTHTVLLSVTS